MSHFVLISAWDCMPGGHKQIGTERVKKNVIYRYLQAIFLNRILGFSKHIAPVDFIETKF
jgi:hypothetical protein